MKQYIRSNVKLISKINELEFLSKYSNVYNNVHIAEYDNNARYLQVKCPVGLSPYLIIKLKAARKNIDLKLDVTAAKNYYLLIVALSNLCDCNSFEASLSSLNKATFTGKKDINSHTCGVNNILFNLSVLEHCGLIHVEELRDSRVRISDIKVPTVLTDDVDDNTQNRYCSVYFRYETVNDKLDFINSVTFQNIDLSNFNVNLNEQQVALLRSHMNITKSVIKEIFENCDEDMACVYGRWLEKFIQEENKKHFKDKLDNDSSLFHESSLISY